MRRIFALLLCFTIGCSIISEKSSSEEENYNLPELEQNDDSVHKLLKLHNTQRELKGRVGFTLDSGLCEYAQKHAEWMAKHHSMTHSNISVLVNRYGFVAENIAWNQRTEEEVVNAWMNSEGHRINIMNRNYTKIGFGIVIKNNEIWWCTNFGS